MAKGAVALALLIGAACPLAIGQESQLPAVFNIALKAPIKIAPCQRDSLGVRAPQGGVCAWQRDGQDFADPAFSGELVVHYWVGLLPWYVQSNQVQLEIVAGKVEQVRFFTGGISQQDFVNRDLRQKFGEPSKVLPRTLKNAYGATFETGIWMWSVGDVRVSHWGSFSRLNDGMVSIGTTIGSEAQDAREKLLQERVRPKIPL